MKTPLGRFFVISFVVIVVLISGALILTKSHNAPLLNEDNNENQRVAIFYLDGAFLHFDCLNTRNCFANVYLGDKIRAANTPDHSLYLVSYFRDNNSHLFLLLSGSARNYLVKVNLATNLVQILDLNIPLLSTGGNLPMFFPGMGRFIHGKIVVATTDGKIGIVQDDFSIKTIDLQSPIFDFIESTDSSMAVVSADDRLQNNRILVKVFIVDVVSDRVEEKKIDGPQETGWIVTVDQDIKHLYWVGSKNNLPDNVLHVFDIQEQKDVLSIPISNTDALAYTTLTSARYQYQKIWYYSRRCCLEGPAPGMMINMSTLKPVINPDDFLKGEADATFIIAPFEDNFLIGTDSRVFVVSQDGKVIKTYYLPGNWVGRDYLFLEYRK